MKILFATLFLVSMAICLSCCNSTESISQISILSMERISGVDQPGADICSSFNLTRNDVAIYFATAEEVSDYEFNRDAIIFPCKYTGELNINGESFQWEISAGGAGYLYRGKDVSKQFLCKAKCSTELPAMSQ